MTFIDMNDALKASLFDDEEAADRLHAAGVTGRRLARMRGPNRTRRSRRTDFARWRAGGSWFGRGGRSMPTCSIQVGTPDVFRFMHGMRVRAGQGVDFTTVHAINVPRGTIWVTQ